MIQIADLVAKLRLENKDLKKKAEESEKVMKSLDGQVARSMSAVEAAVNRGTRSAKYSFNSLERAVVGMSQATQASLSSIDQNMQKAMAKMSASVKRTAKDTEEAVKSTSRNFKDQIEIVKRLAAAYGAFKLAAVSYGAVKLAARYETLGVVMQTVGNNSGYSNQQMTELQKTLQRTGIAAVESRQTLIKMAQAHLDLSQASKLARIAQDAAVIGNINSSEAFERMIYGIQSAQIEVLRTIGINVNFENSYKKVATQLGKTTLQLTESEKAAARMGVVIEAGTRIAGTYESAMGTAGKQALSLQRYVDDLKVKLGSLFTPVMLELVQAFTAALKDANAQLSDEEVAKRFGTQLRISVISVEAEIVRLAMLVDKIGAGLTYAKAIGKGILGFDVSKENAFLKELGSRYAADDKQLEALANKQIELENSLTESYRRSAASKAEAEEKKRLAAAKTLAAMQAVAEAEAMALDKAAKTYKSWLKEMDKELPVFMRNVEASLDPLEDFSIILKRMGEDSSAFFQGLKGAGQLENFTFVEPQKGLGEQAIESFKSSANETLSIWGTTLEGMKEISKNKSPFKNFEKEIKELDKITERTFKGESFGNELADGINNAVVSMQSLIDMYDELEKNQKTANDWKDKLAETEDLTQRKKIQEDLAAFEERKLTDQIGGYRQLAGTISQTFEEGSKARKAFHTVEMALAGIEIAIQAKKAIANAVTAVSAQGEVPIVGFGLVAAMAALMAGVLSQAGISFSGGGGGAGAVAVPATTNFSGTVLGDVEASSESVQNVVDIMEDIHADEYPELQGIHREMIELNNNITGLVSSVIREGGDFSAFSYAQGVSTVESFLDQIPAFLHSIDTMFDNKILNFAAAAGKIFYGWAGFEIGGRAISDIAGEVFGGDVSTRLYEVGYQIGEISDRFKGFDEISESLRMLNPTIGSLLNGAMLPIQQYQAYRVKVDGGWFSGDDKTYHLEGESVTTDVQRLFTTVFQGVGESLIDLGDALGADVEAIKEYAFEIGNIDLKDLSGEEISDKIQAVISTAADTAADALFDGIEKYQQVGEGLYETAARLVIDKEIVLSSLESIGMGFAGFADSLDAVAFSESLLTIAGDLETFVGNVSRYFTSFFSHGEQLTQIGEGLSNVLSNLPILRSASDPFGLSALSSAESLKDVVSALDLTTEAGKEAFTAIMTNVEAFKEFYDLSEEKKNALKEVTDGMADFFHPLSEYGELVVGVRDKVEGWIETMREWGVSIPDESELQQKAIGVATGRFAKSIDDEITDAINQATLSSEDYQILGFWNDLQARLEIIGEMGPDYAYLADKAQELYDIQLRSVEEQTNLEENVTSAKQEYLSALQRELGVLQDAQQTLESLYETAKAVYSTALSTEISRLTEIQTSLENAAKSTEQDYIDAIKREIASKQDFEGVIETSMKKWNDLSSTIQDTINDLLLGSSSPLSRQQQTDEAGRMFRDAVMAIQGGNFEGAQDISSVASTYLNTARGSIGNRFEFSRLFSDVQAQLSQASAIAGNYATSPPDVQTAMNSKQTVEVLQQILDGLVPPQLSMSEAAIAYYDASQALRKSNHQELIDVYQSKLNDLNGDVVNLKMAEEEYFNAKMELDNSTYTEQIKLLQEEIDRFDETISLDEARNRLIEAQTAQAASLVEILQNATSTDAQYWEQEISALQGIKDDLANLLGLSESTVSDPATPTSGDVVWPHESPDAWASTNDVVWPHESPDAWASSTNTEDVGDLLNELIALMKADKEYSRKSWRILDQVSAGQDSFKTRTT